MELQDIKTLWKASYTDPAAAADVNYELLREVSFQKTQKLLTEFTLTTWIEHIVNTIALIIMIGYIINHMHEVRFAAAGLVLAVLFAYDIFWSIRHLRTIYRLDYHMPVFLLQKKIASFIDYEKRESRLLYWMIPVFWIFFLIVGAEAFLQMDLYHKPTFLLTQFIGAAIIAPFIVLLIKMLPDRDLMKANEFLKDLEDIEDDHL